MMKTLTSSLGAAVLLLLCSQPALAADAPPMDSFSINFAKIELDVANPGKTGLAPGKYSLRGDRDQLRGGDRVEVRLASKRTLHPLRIVAPALALEGCETAEGSPAPAFGARSVSRVTPRGDGGLAVQIWAEGSRTCSFELVVPPAPDEPPAPEEPRTVQRPAGPGTLVSETDPPQAPPRFPPDSGSPQPDEPPPPRRETTLVAPPEPPPPPPRPVGPGGLTIGQRPPQCAPPHPQHDSGSPQPSLLELGLTATPVSPPDADCEMSEIASFSELQGITTKVDVVNRRELLSALSALRRNVESLAKVQPENTRQIATARGRVRQSLAGVSRASRSGELAEVAAQCERNFATCDNYCGERECCCCIARYVTCLIE